MLNSIRGESTLKLPSRKKILKNVCKWEVTNKQARKNITKAINGNKNKEEKGFVFFANY